MIRKRKKRGKTQELKLNKNDSKCNDVLNKFNKKRGNEDNSFNII